jgi:hypothetical protein
VGLPFLVGKPDPSTGGILSYSQGFQLKGSNQYGQCLTSISPDALTDFGDPFLNFGETITYGCGVSLTLAELQAYCANSETNTKTLAIFQNLEFF